MIYSHKKFKKNLTTISFSDILPALWALHFTHRLCIGVEEEVSEAAITQR